MLCVSSCGAGAKSPVITIGCLRRGHAFYVQRSFSAIAFARVIAFGFIASAVPENGTPIWIVKVRVPT